MKCAPPVLIQTPYMPWYISLSRKTGPFIIKEDAGTGLKNVCCGDSWQITVHGTQFYNPRYHWLKDKQSWSTFFCPCTSIPRWPCSSKQKVDLNLIMTSVLSHHLSDKKKSCCSPTWLNSQVTLGKRVEGTKASSWLLREADDAASALSCKHLPPEIFVFTCMPARAPTQVPFRF